jgi:hypothetical protein
MGWRQRVLCAMCALFLLVASGCGAGGGVGESADAASTLTPPGSSHRSRLETVADGVCSVLENEVGEKAIEKIGETLIEVVTRHESHGGLGLQGVIAAAHYGCAARTPLAIEAVTSIHLDNPLRTADLPTISGYRSTLGGLLTTSTSGDALREAGFLLSDAQAKRFVDTLHRDARGGQKLGITADLRTYVPGAKLGALSALQSVERAVLSRHPRLSRFQADQLISSVTSFVLENEALDIDTLPPFLLSPTWRWTGPDTISISWPAVDVNGVSSWDLWMQYQHEWSDLIPAKEDGVFSIQLNSARELQFALRATDARGNTSDFGYLRPCLTCAH